MSKNIEQADSDDVAETLVDVDSDSTDGYLSDGDDDEGACLFVLAGAARTLRRSLRRSSVRRDRFSEELDPEFRD